MSDRVKKLLYIAGFGRSGSTLLANVLGGLEGFVNVGELQRIWERGILEQGLCGCQQKVVECPKWQAVFKAAYGGFEQASPVAMVKLMTRLLRTRHMPFVLSCMRKRFRVREQQEFTAALKPLYDSIFQVFGAHVLIDASKYPSYLGMLPAGGDFSIYVIHLVRDPRAVAYSWRRKKYDPEMGSLFGRISLVRSSLVWLFWNAVLELMKKSRRQEVRFHDVRYEDLAQDPERVIREIVRFLDADVDSKDLFDKGTMRLGTSHSIAGNPGRFGSQGFIKADNEWTEKLARTDKCKVTALTFPLLKRYGYRMLR